MSFTERPTKYSLWSRGRLLGHTDLGYVRWLPRHRMGDLITTEIGDRLMPVATGSARALNVFVRTTIDRAPATGRGFDGERGGKRDELHEGTTEFADVAEALVHADSLELELRGPDGLIVPTASIAIQDTHFLLELAREFEDDDFEPVLSDEDATQLAADIEHDAAILDDLFENETEDFADVPDFTHADEPWQESAYPRYQIMVRLIDDDDVP